MRLMFCDPRLIFSPLSFSGGPWVHGASRVHRSPPSESASGKVLGVFQSRINDIGMTLGRLQAVGRGSKLQDG